MLDEIIIGDKTKLLFSLLLSLHFGVSSCLSSTTASVETMDNFLFDEEIAKLDRMFDDIVDIRGGNLRCNDDCSKSNVCKFCHISLLIQITHNTNHLMDVLFAISNIFLYLSIGNSTWQGYT